MIKVAGLSAPIPSLSVLRGAQTEPTPNLQRTTFYLETAEVEDFIKSDMKFAQNDTILAVACTFLSVAWLTVSLRVWVRASLIKNFGWDDGFIIMASISYSLFTAFNILQVLTGNVHRLSFAELERLVTVSSKWSLL